jgi:hypothetical protein
MAEAFQSHISLFIYVEEMPEIPILLIVSAPAI